MAASTRADLPPAVRPLPGARRALTGAVQRRLTALWAGLGSWRDRDQDPFIEQAVTHVRAGQRALADRVAAQTARDAALALGAAAPEPLGLTDDEAVNLREGIEDAEVYRRPFVTTYTALSKGERFPDALKRGQVRLTEIVEMDMQQAYARANMVALNRLPAHSRPTHWRRVLVGEVNCALCTLASTQRYSLSDLNPIHPGCDCAVVGVYGEDPGDELDDERLAAVHAAAAELTGTEDAGGRSPDYRSVLLRSVRNHGEVGPMLVRPTDHFDGPRQVAA